MPAQRIREFTESVLREMTRLSLAHGAINLAQGFPDFPANETVKRAAAEAIAEDFNQYTVTWGLGELRQALARKLAEFNGIQADPDREITVTCGATEAIMAGLLAHVDPGDEVIVFEPVFESYPPDILLCEATPVYVPLEGLDFRVDPDRLRAAFSPRTRAILVNTPHNPTGKVFTRPELELIARLCQEFDVLAITDEIYERLIYDDYEHISLATLPGMAERTITVGGFSKTFGVTGWRLGYAAAAPAHTDAIRKVHDYMTCCAPAPMQRAGIAALGLPASYYTELRAGYVRRRDLLLAALREAGFACAGAHGTYFLMADAAPLGCEDDLQFARMMLREIGIGAVPGRSFYHEPGGGRTLLRFAFCKRDATLAEAAQRLKQLREVLARAG